MINIKRCKKIKYLFFNKKLITIFPKLVSLVHPLISSFIFISYCGFKLSQLLKYFMVEQSI